MARRKTKPHLLTELELEIMQVIWGIPEACDVEVISAGLSAQGRRIAPSSVRTMMTILENKGFVGRTVEGRRHLFHGKVGKEAAQQAVAAEVLQTAFKGSAPAFVAALLGTGQVDRESLQRVRQLLDEAEQREPK